MEIRLHMLDPQHFSEPAFLLTIEPGYLGAVAVGESAWLTTQARIVVGSLWKTRFLGSNLMLLDLHITISSGSNDPTFGLSLLPPEELPLGFFDLSTDYDYPVRLTFPVPHAVAQQLEDERARSQPNGDLRLKLRVWGGVLVTTPQGSFVARVHSEGIDPELHIARSDWLDRLLPNIGYPQRRTFVLPPVSADRTLEEMQEAARHLSEAWTLFAHERYREAVQRCRQAKDALLGTDKTGWAHTALLPAVGGQKADMINDALRALNHLGNAASHGDNTVEIDRDAAEFVLSSLTLILAYIDRKLK